MHINMKSDISKATAKLRGVQKKQIPFAVAKALSDTAWDVAKEESKQMPAKLDRPTPFSVKAFWVIRATKQKLVATVFIKPIQAAYLKFQVDGGTRRPKGKAMPVPGDVRLNQYGNMSKGKIKALLSDPRNFSGVIHGNGGIWQRQKNGGVKLLVAWEKTAQYERDRFPFYKIAIGKAKAVIGSNLRRAIDSAMRSAK